MRHISPARNMTAGEQDTDAIPVIDISKPSVQVAHQVLDAASTHGFLYIKNDGVTIPPQDIDGMFKLVRNIKREIKIHY
jgi:isopenicillin N synthase-like dioxygenase